MKEFFTIIKRLGIEAGGVAKDYRWGLVVLVISIVVLVGVIWPFDKGVLQQTQMMSGEGMMPYIRWISMTGDFHYAPTFVFLFLLGLGIWRKSRSLRIAAVAILLGAGSAGIAVNILKPMFGRPRPYTQIEDGFYPLRVSHEHGSLPSGHASSTLGLTVATGIIFPPSIIVGLPYSIEVCRSRMVLDRHYLSDIVAGVGLGTFCGGLFGVAGRRLRKQQWVPESDRGKQG